MFAESTFPSFSSINPVAKRPRHSEDAPRSKLCGQSIMKRRLETFIFKMISIESFFYLKYPAPSSSKDKPVLKPHLGTQGTFN
jgi:hypothetical protein